MVLVYNGIDTEHFYPAQPPQRAIIGTVARLSPIKDQATLLKAFAQFKTLSTIDAELHIAGDGELMGELQQLAQQLNIQHQVRFLGHQTNMRPLYQGFSLFTLSSLAEGIPMTALEAMACGLPVVATHVGGLPELITHNGTLVPAQDPNALAEAWQQYLSDDATRQLAGQRSRERVIKDFSETAMVGAYQKLYLGEQ